VPANNFSQPTDLSVAFHGRCRFGVASVGGSSPAFDRDHEPARFHAVLLRAGELIEGQTVR